VVGRRLVRGTARAAAGGPGKGTGSGSAPGECGLCYQKAGEFSRAANLYRAALAGPLREDTRQEVQRMLAGCLAELTEATLGSAV